jgi:hypothetical protein
MLGALAALVKRSREYAVRYLSQSPGLKIETVVRVSSYLRRRCRQHRTPLRSRRRQRHRQRYRPKHIFGRGLAPFPKQFDPRRHFDDISIFSLLLVVILHVAG